MSFGASSDAFFSQSTSDLSLEVCATTSRQTQRSINSYIQPKLIVIDPPKAPPRSAPHTPWSSMPEQPDINKYLPGHFVFQQTPPPKTGIAAVEEILRAWREICVRNALTLFSATKVTAEGAVGQATQAAQQTNAALSATSNQAHEITSHCLHKYSQVWYVLLVVAFLTSVSFSGPWSHGVRWTTQAELVHHLTDGGYVDGQLVTSFPKDVPKSKNVEELAREKHWKKPGRELKKRKLKHQHEYDRKIAYPEDRKNGEEPKQSHLPAKPIGILEKKATNTIGGGPISSFPNDLSLQRWQWERKREQKHKVRHGLFAEGSEHQVRHGLFAEGSEHQARHGLFAEGSEHQAR
ncbi:hypothetical protein CYMTET_29755, partial [Cymbomonas tetramitiformis]